MKTMLFLIGVLASSVRCAAECDFPREVEIPADWLIEYRGIADTVRYTGESLYLEWDDEDGRLLVNGDPYPVPDDHRYSDGEWMAVPRYAELRKQGRSASEAGRIYEKEKRILLRRANEEFRRRLAHRFTDAMDPGQRAEAIEGISPTEKDEALAHAAAILVSHPFVEATGEFIHLDPATSRVTVRFHGRPPLEVRFDLTGRYVREEYTRRQACQLAARLASLPAGDSGVIILQGGGRRTIRGFNAEKHRASAR